MQTEYSYKDRLKKTGKTITDLRRATRINRNKISDFLLGCHEELTWEEEYLVTKTIDQWEKEMKDKISKLKSEEETHE